MLCRVSVALCALLIAGCAPQQFDTGFLTMGTTASVSVLAADATQAQRASNAVEQRWQRQSTDWYAYGDAAGELPRLNVALAAGQRFTASDELLGLLQTSQRAHSASQGYFDPAIAPMVAAWGFASASDPASAPTAAQQQAWLQQPPTLADLHIQDHVVSSSRTTLRIDLGGIAKGYALDVAAQVLQADGISDALLNLGGQVLMLGPRMARRSDAIAIRAPRESADNTPGAALALIHLQSGESLATSGDYERFHDAGNTRTQHVLDPHTGRPVTHTQAVTVIAQSGAWADAASTALMAAGPEHWQNIAHHMGIREALRIDASGEVQVTAAMYARLRWPAAAPPHLTIIQPEPAN